MLQSKTTPNSQWLKTTKVFFCSCCVSIEGKLQPLLHIIISFSLWNPVSVWNVAGPKAERKELWRSAFFFFFFLTQKAWGGFYLFCVFFCGGVVLATPRGICGLCSTRVQTHAPCIGSEESTIQPTEKSLEGS